ncbi:MAG TPA: FMN-binding negative transcriptional regulator [Candidatus Baltobacteraceae bacterium]|nr:FMN-binding negative transcriptional regulator [Candidatus Baltobacteraceae bacterium]
MYVPKHFAIEDRDALISFIRREPFGILVSNDAGAPIAAHVPIMLLEESGALVLGLHVAKANSQWKGIDGRRVLAIFQGAHAMISASWYAQPHLDVPTWDYSAVHCSGTARVTDANATRTILERTVSQLEPRWRIADADASSIERMQQAIVGVRIDVDGIQGVRKHSQNRTPEDRLRVITQLESSARAMDRELAREMRTTEA